jgi:antitoxin StbD
VHYLVRYFGIIKALNLPCHNIYIQMPVTNAIFAGATVSITDLRRNPGAIIEEAGDAAVAILNHNRPAAYLISAHAFERMLERLEDGELAEIVRKRRGGKTVKVSLDAL